MFEVALKRVLKHEGGLVSDPDDTFEVSLWDLKLNQTKGMRFISTDLKYPYGI